MSLFLSLEEVYLIYGGVFFMFTRLYIYKLIKTFEVADVVG